MNLSVILVILLCYASAVYSAQETNDIVASSTIEYDIPSSTPKVMLTVEDNVVEKAINEFGFKLIKTLLKDREDSNVVTSPTSVAGVLAMTLLGSAGSTYDELAEILGFTQDILTNRKYHEDFGSRLRSLNANDTKTLYANAVFVDRHARLRGLYHAYLERVYRGEALQADFRDNAAKAKQIMNDWVSNHTNNKIENFLSQPLAASTKVVLLSALYFSGQWAVPFLQEHTRKMPFKTPNKEVLADLMFNTGKFKHIISFEHELQMIALPYNDTVTNMYALKPIFPNRKNISELLNNLDYDKIDQLIHQMKNESCLIRFPKMDLIYGVDLTNSLKELGARSMFKPDVANFAVMLESDHVANEEDELLSRINAGEGEARTLKDMVNRFANPGVHVDLVMHQVKMNIDEYGTEAAAASSVITSRTVPKFYANSPFFLFIRNENTKLVTFSAVVTDPTLKGMVV